MLYTNALKQLDMQDISIVLLLIENRSAKRVAEMLNLSQSSISYSLKKLRHCFDDKLFERSSPICKTSCSASISAPRKEQGRAPRCVSGISLPRNILKFSCCLQCCSRCVQPGATGR